MTIGGHTIIHNAIAHDYCVAECIASVLPLVDKFLIIECESTDGTLDLLKSIASKEPKLIIEQDEWRPRKKPPAWTDEITMRHYKNLGTDWHIAMDADELLHPDQYDLIRKHVETQNVTGSLYRHTFWKNAQYTTKDHQMCGPVCARVAPLSQFLCFDHVTPPGTVPIPGANTYHYGHIRKKEPWKKKSLMMHWALLGWLPKEWAAAEKGDMSLVENCLTIEELVPFKGTHPPMIHQWLIDRGYHP